MQFHAYRLAQGVLVVDLQSDRADVPTRVVAPLVPVAPDVPPLSRLELIFNIDGIPHALHVGELATVRRRTVAGAAVADLSDQGWAIRKALDFLFSGF